MLGKKATGLDFYRNDDDIDCDAYKYMHAYIVLYTHCAGSQAMIECIWE